MIIIREKYIIQLIIMNLKQKLQGYRDLESDKRKINRSRILTNRTIDELIKFPPRSGVDLRLTPGIGPTTELEYGKDILEICKEYEPMDPVVQQQGTVIPNPLPSEDIILSETQREIFQHYDNGENIFMSGQGGTGKTFMIRLLVERYIGKKKIAMTALTGVAADLLGDEARTLHSWSGTGCGISLTTSAIDKIILKIMKEKSNLSSWKTTDILIVDEVSMMSKSLFEILDSIGKRIRRDPRPFGGIQLIFSGDFHQLPPIGKDKDTKAFCFESPLWESTFHKVIILQKLFRQKDPLFMKILQQVRRGKISINTNKILQSKIIKNNEIFNDKNIPTIISPLRNLVKQINDKNMSQLTTEMRTFSSKIETTELFQENTSPQKLKYHSDLLEKRMNADKEITLKIGCHVMCVANLPTAKKSRKIVNGSQGIVVDFIDNLPQVKFINGDTRLIQYHSWESEEILGLKISQIPLILSYAITIHKSQGLTLESAIVDIGDSIFEYGQTYVALSRLTSLDGLYLRSFSHRKITTNPRVKQYYESIVNCLK